MAKPKINLWLVLVLATALAACTSTPAGNQPELVTVYEGRDFTIEFKQPTRLGESPLYRDAYSHEFCLGASCLRIFVGGNVYVEFKKPSPLWVERSFLGHFSFRRDVDVRAEFIIATKMGYPDRIHLSFDLADEAVWMENIVKLEFVE